MQIALRRRPAERQFDEPSVFFPGLFKDLFPVILADEAFKKITSDDRGAKAER